jgi:alanyl-tRNA synthetase
LNSLKISRDVFKVENHTDLLCEISSNIVDSLKYSYPELAKRKSYIQDVIRQTDDRQKLKQTHWTEITDRYLKKLPNKTNKLSGEQIWKLFKGDGSGDEVSIEFIQNKLNEKGIEFDMEGFNKLYLAHNEKAIKNQKNTRNDLSSFIEVASLIKNLPKTDDSFKYLFDLDTNRHEAIFKNQQALKAKIVSLAVIDKTDKKYKLVDQISSNEECLIVLNKTNFYSEGGGQVSDRGFLKYLSNNQSIEIKNCYNIQGHTFHIGKLVDSNGIIKLNDEIECHIDSQSRFNITLNHTGVHLMNHAIRNAYEKEDSIFQVQSSVRSDSFKFEFKFNQIVAKPDSNKLEQIESICRNLIKQSLPVYINENVELDDEKLNELNYPVRKLNDILYPNKVRVLSVGTKLDGLLSNQPNSFYSAELCCGTHVTNTHQLKNLIITHLEVVGDSSFELHATTGQNTLKIIENDERVLSFFNEMKEIYLEPNNTKYLEMNSHEKCKYLNELAELSASIENIFKTQTTSYLVKQKIKEESVKFRPSKTTLQSALKKHFEDELIEDSPTAVNAAVIAKINDKPSFSIKFLAFTSILFHDSILSILNKIDKLHPALIIYNSQRECYYFYSKHQNKDLKNYFDLTQSKMLEANPNSSLVETGKNYRIIKCPMVVNKKHSKIDKSYFNF